MNTGPVYCKMFQSITIPKNTKDCYQNTCKCGYYPTDKILYKISTRHFLLYHNVFNMDFSEPGQSPKYGFFRTRLESRIWTKTLGRKHCLKSRPTNFYTKWLPAIFSFTTMFSIWIFLSQARIPNMDFSERG